MSANFEFFLPEARLPVGFVYPKSYRQCEHGELPLLDPWHFFYGRLEHHFDGLRIRYPNRVLVPFARRKDNDDVACFDAAANLPEPRVEVIHDWADPGWEQRESFGSFSDWLSWAVEESRTWRLSRL